MLTVTTETVPGFEIVEALGVVRGNVVRTKHVGTDIVASLQTLVGGEVQGYTAMIAGAREQAVSRMEGDARRMGADAVVGLRFSTSMVMRGASEMLAVGTAVRLRRKA